jgi:hypothetical protein
MQTLWLTLSVMLTEVGIHAFYERKQRHGWRNLRSPWRLHGGADGSTTGVAFIALSVDIDD